MEMCQLRSFLQVAEDGSISRAATALFLSQPAVTKHVRALERELGSPLLARTGRGVLLTEAGKTFREYARRALAILDEGRQMVEDIQGGAAGRLVIAAGLTTSILYLPRWLRSLQETFPGVDVVVRTGPSREVARLTLDREVDLGIITSPMEHPDLIVTPLLEEEIVLVAPSGHPRAAGGLSGNQLGEIPLILFPRGTGFREYVDGFLKNAGIPARVKMESDSVEATKRFVAVGLGFSFLPRAAIAEEVAAGELAAIVIEGLPALRRRTTAIHRRDRHLTAAGRGFLFAATTSQHLPPNPAP